MYRLVAIGLVTLFSAVTLNAGAQQYPNKPVRLMNPNAPGGVSDTMSRSIAKAMEPSLGQTILVENRPGAVGVPGIDAVLKGPADGYFIGNTCPGPVVVLPVTGEPVPYDFEKEAVIVGMMGGLDVGITTRAGNPVSNLEQLIAQARANPGKVNIGMVQTPSNVIPIAFMAKRAGVQINIIGYKGEVFGLNDVLGGTLEYTINAPGTVMPHIQAGTVKQIVMLAKDRNQALPNVPSLSDTKVEVFPPNNYCIMFGSKALPADVLRKLNASLNEAGKDAALRKSWVNQGLVPYIGDTVAGATAFFADIGKRWREVVKEVDYGKYR